jgi:UDP:flavonoid glycosyltransferase YjiC (YdhE family)
VRLLPGVSHEEMTRRGRTVCCDGGHGTVSKLLSLYLMFVLSYI